MSLDCHVRRRRPLPSSRVGFDVAEEGSALVELCVFLPIVIPIILSATELAFYIQRSMIVVEAASVGARFGIIAGNASNVTGMSQAAKSASDSLGSGIGVGDLNVMSTTFCSCTPGGANMSCNSTCGASVAISHYVQVTTSATVPGLFNVAGLPTSMHPTTTSTMRASWYGQ